MSIFLLVFRVQYNFFRIFCIFLYANFGVYTCMISLYSVYTYVSNLTGLVCIFYLSRPLSGVDPGPGFRYESVSGSNSSWGWDTDPTSVLKGSRADFWYGYESGSSSSVVIRITSVLGESGPGFWYDLSESGSSSCWGWDTDPTSVLRGSRADFWYRYESRSSSSDLRQF